jgi:hypothetical protein
MFANENKLILISTNLVSKKLISILANQQFHCPQFFFPPAYNTHYEVYDVLLGLDIYFHC